MIMHYECVESVEMPSSSSLEASSQKELQMV